MIKAHIKTLILLSVVFFNANAQKPGELIGGDAGVTPGKLWLSMKKIDLYADMHIGWVRIGMGPELWWDKETGKPLPRRADMIVDYAIDRGLKPYFLLNFDPGFHGGSIDDFNWEKTGKAFSKHFKGRVCVFTVFNEPDHIGHETITPDEMAHALQAFSRGARIHQPNCIIASGGLAVMDKEHSDIYALMMGPLLNEGVLDALNIHNYTGMTNPSRGARNGTNDWSAQKLFDRFKKAGNVKRNIYYCSAEWNIRNKIDELDPVAAADFLAAFWGHMGVVGNEGNGDHKTLFASVYQIWLPIYTKGYGLADQVEPWIGNERGKVLDMVLDLSHDLNFIEINTYDKGEYILEKSGVAKLWVYQNITGWKDGKPVGEVHITDIPEYADKLEVWYWDGRSAVIDVIDRQMTVPIREEETVMIKAVRAWSPFIDPK